MPHVLVLLNRDGLFFFFFKLRRFYWTKLLAGSCGENNLTGKGYNFLIPRRDPLSQVLATMYMLSSVKVYFPY